MFTVSDVYLDSPGIRMPDRIAQSLYANPIYFVPNYGIKGLRRSLNLNPQLGACSSRGATRRSLPKLLIACPDQLNSVRLSGVRAPHLCPR